MFKFGPAGIPLQCKDGNTIEGIKCVAALGLQAMELEFVHGCRTGLDKAKEYGTEARKQNVTLSCHASYYLNLLSPEKHKLDNTHREIIYTAKVLDAAGGGRLVFHAGFYLELDKEKAYGEMRKQIGSLLDDLSGLNVTLAPETTGKRSAFGSLEELFELSSEFGFDKLAPCVDWAHVHARENGRFKEEGDYSAVLDLMKDKAGAAALKEMHCHLSGIEFTEKGERRHLPIEADVPPIQPLFHALKKHGCGGTIICESPLLEEDALRLKRLYEKTG